MKTITAKEAMQRLGAFAEQDLSEPLLLERPGRPAAVLMAFAEFQRLKAFEERFWAESAAEARDAGFLSLAESEAWFKRMQERCDAEA